MPHLSPQQFGALSDKLQRGDGFTVHPQTGESPASGWLVGQKNTEYKSPTVPTGSEISAYADKHEGTLSQPEHYLGGWENYLDTPRRMPEEGPGDVVPALKEMAKQGQLAIYGIREGNGDSRMSPEEREIYRPQGGEIRSENFISRLAPRSGPPQKPFPNFDLGRFKPEY